MQDKYARCLAYIGAEGLGNKLHKMQRTRCISAKSGETAGAPTYHEFQSFLSRVSLFLMQTWRVPAIRSETS
jgi:hypothetical protein